MQFILIILRYIKEMKRDFHLLQEIRNITTVVLHFSLDSQRM